MSRVTLSKILKGLYAGAVAFLTGLGTALNDDKSLGQLAAGQWVWILLGTVVAIGGAYGLAGWAGPSVGTTSSDSNVSKGS